MQDIVFYAAANETLGVVRDYANARNQSAPVLTLGVSVCLRIRLFAESEGAAPYPVSSFNGITKWKWRMDGDFDRSTTCKLVADDDDISVHSVTDTVNGETRSFTEFVIPISDMNTQELTAWLGSEKQRSGLTGELVGYDADDNAAFVLQIENFTVRNRVAGLGNPTAINQECVTYDQADLMIRTTVSSSAATKQDKLTAANGGTGISVSDAGIISVSDIPQSAVTGLTSSLDDLSTSLGTKQDTLTAGCRMLLVSGSTVDQARYFAIEPAVTAPANQTTTVVLSAGKAYEIHAVAANAKVLLNREEPLGGTHTFGLEGHAEIFVANTGCIQTGEHVVLSQPLEPDAINYCTVRFRRGMAVISVEDHIGGYIVVDGGTAGSGTLNYGLASAGSQYIAFNDTLAGQAINMNGAVTNGAKAVVGNGSSDTILTGGVSCTGKTTFANLAMSAVSVLGGTMTLGDVYIPSGATVSVSGGGLAIEKVTGNGGTIDLGGRNVVFSSGGTVTVSGCTVTGGLGFASPSSSFVGGAFNVSNTNASLYGVTFSGNAVVYAPGISTGACCGGACNFARGTVVLSSCTFVDNTTPTSRYTGDAFAFMEGATVSLTDCALLENQTVEALRGELRLSGSNTIRSVVSTYGGFGAGSGTVVIRSGAIVDLTGNPDTNPIVPGSGVMFEPGGATILTGATAGVVDAQYMLGGMKIPKVANRTLINLVGTTATVNSGTVGGFSFTSGTMDLQDAELVSGTTVAVGTGGSLTVEKVTGSGTIDLGGTNLVISSGGTAYASGVSFVSGGDAQSSGGAFYVEQGTLIMSGAVITNNTARYAGGIYAALLSLVTLTNCTVSGNTTSNYQNTKDMLVGNYGKITISGCTVGYCGVGINGELAFAGSNTVEKVGNFFTGNAGSVTISSGAIINLTSSIVPGGGITIPAGAVVTIIGSGGSSGYFSELALTGTTITNAGLIYGATVTVPASGGPWEVNTTEGDSTLTADGTEQQIVISGGVSYIGGL